MDRRNRQTTDEKCSEKRLKRKQQWSGSGSDVSPTLTVYLVGYSCVYA